MTNRGERWRLGAAVNGMVDTDGERSRKVAKLLA
jgi:hypothetical protein